MKPDTFWVPETSTPLYYSPVYGSLTDRQKWAYNRLHGCAIAELISFVEETLPACYVKAVSRAGVPETLRAEVMAWAESEKRHAAMFHQMLQRVHPDLYAVFTYHFTRVAPPAVAFLQMACSTPILRPFVFLLGLIAEERAAWYGAEVVRHGAELQPEMVDAHRRHLRDEANHLALDEVLLALTWEASPAWVRRGNAKLFSWVVGEYLCAPKRGAIRVVDYWMKECPELAPRRAELVRATLQLRNQLRYHESVYSRRTVPRSFALFDRHEEFRDLGKSLWAYSPEAPR